MGALSPELWWRVAQRAERTALGEVHSRLLATDSTVSPEVRHALCIEVIEDYDYRSWPETFVLHNVIWNLQEAIVLPLESQEVDRVQRMNYMRLAMAGKERHNDVAYGLSGKMVIGGDQLPTEKREFLDALLEMGTRSYRESIPEEHELENNVLHVAVSYRHSSAWDKQGTINRLQAEAIWLAIRSMPYMDDRKEVRVWVDQNLHREESPEGTEWHEFGLLPYACLPVVGVGDGNFSLEYASTRPWIWVETLTALKANGLHVAPGLDVVSDCEHILTRMPLFERLKPAMTRHGWLMGARRNVDDVMSEITRNISLWRRDGFLNHSGYEFADEFELFVNWARWFVIRGVKYSEMSWNHSSSRAVTGMDAVVLLRAMPRSGGPELEPVQGIVQANISWTLSQETEEWIVSDIFDRTMIDDLPLRAILECAQGGRSNAAEMAISGQMTTLQHAQFRKENGVVSVVYGGRFGRQGNDLGEIATMFTTALSQIWRKVVGAEQLSVVRTDGQFGDLVTYTPFTRRVQIAAGQESFPGRNGQLIPRELPVELQQRLGLKAAGVFNDSGICECIYELQHSGKIYRVCTSELSTIDEASNSTGETLKTFVAALKGHSFFKEILYRDLPELERLDLTRGWDVERLLHSHGQSPGNDLAGGTENEGFGFCDQNVLSGEAKMDVLSELQENLRLLSRGYILVWVNAIDGGKVQIIFRSKREKRTVTTNEIFASREVAILEETPLDELANENSTGLIQMLAGVQPRLKVRRFGSGVNPRIQTSEKGVELNIKAVDGMFAVCKGSGKTVCQLNGLEVDLRDEGDLYRVEWRGRYQSVGRGYERFPLRTGTRIV